MKDVLNKALTQLLTTKLVVLNYYTTPISVEKKTNFSN